MPKRYNTPHRSRVVKTRLSEDEYADFTARLAPYGISQSEFLRQAVSRPGRPSLKRTRRSCGRPYGKPLPPPPALTSFLLCCCGRV